MSGTSWLTRVLGRPAEIPQRTTIDELVASRSWLDELWEGIDYGGGVKIRRAELATLGDRTILGEIVEPAAGQTDGLIISIHGGGWALGSARSDRIWNARLARAGFRVIAPDYGLAPEHPHPIPVLDCAAVILETAERLPGSDLPNRHINVLGYSAGANLAAAAVAAILIQDPRLPATNSPSELALRLGLFYGIYDFGRLTEDPAAASTTVRLWRQAYLGTDADRLLDNPLVSPLHAAETLAPIPSYLVCGMQDNLVGQTLSMIDALRAAGGEPAIDLPEGVDHGFLKTVQPGTTVGEIHERTVAWCRGSGESDA